MLLLLLIPVLLLSVPLLALGIILIRRKKDNLPLLALGIVIIALSSSCLAFGTIMFAAIFALS